MATRWTHWLQLATIALLTTPDAATAAARVRSLVDAPVAVRGGVLLVPLSGPVAADDWPQRVRLSLADGRQIEGEVAWFVPTPGGRGWTTDPRRLKVVRHPAGAPRATAHLVARLPSDGEGPIRLDRQELRPRWVDPAAPLTARPMAGEVMVLEERPDRPDPDSPFTYWRWVLLADAIELSPPAPRFGPLGDLVAEHYTDLWLVGLDRLARVDPDLAKRCRTELTCIGIDRQSTFATWEANPQRTSDLLNSMLNQRLNDDHLLAAAQVWIDELEPVLMWLEDDHSDQVRLTMVSRVDRVLVAQLTWPGLDEVPIAVELRHGVLAEVVVDRPVTPPPSSAGGIDDRGASPVLRIDVGDRKFHLPVGPSVSRATPPAAFKHRLRRPVTLTEVQLRVQVTVGDAEATYVHLRRRDARWEVFFECRRPPHGAAAGAEPISLPVDGASEVTTFGQEAVTLFIGPRAGTFATGDAPRAVLVIPERGPERASGGSPLVFRRSYSDRWYARVVLPDAWLPQPGEAGLLLGCARTHGNHDGFEVAPATTTAWRPVAGRDTVDLRHWEQQPGDLR